MTIRTPLVPVVRSPNQARRQKMVPWLSGGFVLSPPLDGVTTGLLSAASLSRRMISTYTGPLFKAFKADGSTYTVTQDANGNADTAGLLAWAAGATCYLRSEWDHVSSTEITLDTNAATARRVVNSGVLETDDSGRVQAVVVTEDTGRLVFPLSSTVSNGSLAVYMYGTNGATRAGGDGRYIAATQGGGSSFASSAFIDGVRNSVSNLNINRTTAAGVRIWQGNPGALCLRYDGSSAFADFGGQVSSAAESQTFLVDTMIFGGLSSATSYAGVGDAYREHAVWSTQSAAGLRAVASNGRYYYGKSTPWRGKNIVWLGTSMPVTVFDSSPQNINPYPQRIAAALGAHIINEGSGSSRLTYSASYQQTLTATIAEQIANGFSGWTTQSYEYKVLGQGVTPDWFVIDHCLNDFDQTQGTLGSTNKATYLGALNFLRTQILTAYPSAKILCLTPPSAKSAVHDETQVRTAAANLLAWAIANGHPYIDVLGALDLPRSQLPDNTHLGVVSTGTVANYIAPQMLAIAP